jgi:hypothetical protein
MSDARHWAYVSGIVAVVIGAVVMRLFFPKHEEEKALLAR